MSHRWADAAGIGPVCQVCGTDDMAEPECVPLPPRTDDTDESLDIALSLSAAMCRCARCALWLDDTGSAPTLMCSCGLAYHLGCADWPNRLRD